MPPIDSNVPLRVILLGLLAAVCLVSDFYMTPVFAMVPVRPKLAAPLH